LPIEKNDEIVAASAKSENEDVCSGKRLCQRGNAINLWDTVGAFILLHHYNHDDDGNKTTNITVHACAA
jgi:hypothetical protein